MNLIKKSPWLCFFSSSDCNGCAIEILNALTPRYDIERFGCMLRPSARHADILLATGPVNKQVRERLKRVYNQMADKKLVVAIGSCAIGGGPFWEAYNTEQGIDEVVPVAAYVPGCPPRPEAIIDGLLKALRRIK